jgi:ribosomal protein S18 acetylase RimI-like enzyme
MGDVRLRAMTPREFAELRVRLDREYAKDNVRAGSWPAEGAQERAARETDRLLPHGVETPGMLLYVAETSSGDPIGYLWLGLKGPTGPGGGAWIYDIEIAEAWRGQGFGRAVLQLAEEEAVRHGINAMGLNVFGNNTVARRLYESSGYITTSMWMKKPLHPDAAPEAPSE